MYNIFAKVSYTLVNVSVLYILSCNMSSIKIKLMQELKVKKKLWMFVYRLETFLKEGVEMLMFQIKEEKLWYGPNRHLYSTFFWGHLVLAAAICICHRSCLIQHFIFLTGTLSELCLFWMLSKITFTHRFSKTLVSFRWCNINAL